VESAAEPPLAEEREERQTRSADAADVSK